MVNVTSYNAYVSDYGKPPEEALYVFDNEVVIFCRTAEWSYLVDEIGGPEQDAPKEHWQQYFDFRQLMTEQITSIADLPPFMKEQADKILKEYGYKKISYADIE